MITHRVSLYTVPLSAVNGSVVSLLRAMGRHGRFKNFRIGPSLSNRIGTADWNSNRISKLRRFLIQTDVDGHIQGLVDQEGL